jgi:tetratricopeptide (TPR) repeat protein
MAHIHPVTRVQWSPAFNRYRSGGWASKLDLMAKVLKRSHELQMILTRTFHRAGVPILAGTDAPLVFVFPGHSLHQELAYLVDAGLTPYEALEAATAAPARFLGIADRSGTIAVGKRADLVLLEEDPRRDIANTRRIADVFRDGAWLPRERLDRMLANIAAGYEALSAKIAPVAAALQEGRAEDALQAYRAGGASEIAFFVERAVNRLGYRQLNAGDVDGALEIFVLNTEYFPEAFNTWDSLAEAHMVRGDDELAIRYYMKSLELNPENDNATRMIERIKEKGGKR